MSGFEAAIGTDIINADIRAMRQELYGEPARYDGSADIIALTAAIDGLVHLTPELKILCRSKHIPFTGQRDFWDTDDGRARDPLLTWLTLDYVAPRTPDLVTDRYQLILSSGSSGEDLPLTDYYVLRRLVGGKATMHMRLATDGSDELAWESQEHALAGHLMRANTYEMRFLSREFQRLQALPAQQDVI